MDAKITDEADGELLLCHHYTELCINVNGSLLQMLLRTWVEFHLKMISCSSWKKQYVCENILGKLIVWESLLLCVIAMIGFLILVLCLFWAYQKTFFPLKYYLFFFKEEN